MVSSPRSGASSAGLVIVGAGLAGSAAAWSASARGMSVVVLDAFGPGHRLGSSHGSARIFRRAYPDPLYVRMTGRAGESWRRLEEEAGERLLRLTGGLDLGPLRDPGQLHAVLTSCGVPAELLDPDDAAERWPGISFDGTGPVMFHAEAGVLDPERAMAAMLRLAAGHGADVRFNTPVTHISTAPGGGGRVHTDSGMFTAPVVAVAAGGWLAPLLGDLIRLPELTVTQQQAFHFAPRVATAAWPIFIYWDEADYFYGLPGGRDGEVPGAVKLGEHRGGTVTTASGRDGTVDPAARKRALAFAQQRLPGLDSDPVNHLTCLYTTSANEDLTHHLPFAPRSESGISDAVRPVRGPVRIRVAA